VLTVRIATSGKETKPEATTASAVSAPLASSQTFKLEKQIVHGLPPDDCGPAKSGYLPSSNLTH